MQTYARVIADLGSEVCRCGEPKNRKQFFCRKCYWKLPEPYRVRLWRKYGTQIRVQTIYTRCLGFLGLIHPEGEAA